MKQETYYLIKINFSISRKWFPQLMFLLMLVPCWSLTWNIVLYVPGLGAGIFLTFCASVHTNKKFYGTLFVIRTHLILLKKTSFLDWIVSKIMLYL